MYVSESHKIGFIHIPKTGGTFIRRHFLDQLGVVKHRNEDHPFDPVGDSYKDYFIFAFVRCPYNRIASYFRFKWIESRDRPKLTPPNTCIEFIEKWFAGDQKRQLLQKNYVNDSVHIYKYENFESEVKRVIADCGVIIPNPIDFRRMLGDGRLTRDDLYFGGYDVKMWIDKESVDWINVNCDDDFSFFGYKKKTLEQL